MTPTNNKPSIRSYGSQRVAVLAGRVLFRRQVPLLCRFIADFYAPAQRLVIEVDGAYHAERARADARRDVALERAGYCIVRLEASLITRDTDGAVALIRAVLLA